MLNNYIFLNLLKNLSMYLFDVALCEYSVKHLPFTCDNL